MAFKLLINHLTWLFIIIIPLALLLVFFHPNTSPLWNTTSQPPQNTCIPHLRGGAGEPDTSLPSPSSAVRHRHQNRSPGADPTSLSTILPAPVQASKSQPRNPPVGATPLAPAPTQNQNKAIPLCRRRLAIDMHIDLLKAQRHINTALKREIATSKANAKHKQKQKPDARSPAHPELATVGEKQDPPGGVFPQPSTCTHQQQDTSDKETSPSRILYQPPYPQHTSKHSAAFRGRVIDSENQPSPSPNSSLTPPPAPSPPSYLCGRYHDQQPEIAKHIDTMTRQQTNQRTNWVHVDMPLERSAGVHGSGSESVSSSRPNEEIDESSNDHTFNPNPSEPEPEATSPSDSSWTQAHLTTSIELLEREIFYPTVPCSMSETSRLIPISSSSYLAAKAELAVAARQEDEGINAYAHRYDAERELLTSDLKLEPSPPWAGKPESNSKSSGSSLERFSAAAAAAADEEKNEYEAIRAYAHRYDAEREFLRSRSSLNHSPGSDE